MKTVLNDLYIFLSKWWMYVVYILIGLVGKISYELVTDKKRSFWSVMGSVGIAAFTGYISCVWCIHNSPEKAPYLVPMATLLSDKFFTWVFSLNWKGIIDVITNNKLN
jgi:hypothetical protein